MSITVMSNVGHVGRSGQLGVSRPEPGADFPPSMIEEVEPLEGARDLIADLGRRVDRVVLASSAKADEVEHYIDLLEARELADRWTTSADVEATKPEPDLVRSALEKAGADEALLIGDTIWDVEAARRAGVEAAAVLTGGFSEQELRDAGAIVVFESIPELRDQLGELPVVGGA